MEHIKRLANNSRLKNLELPNFDSNNIASDGWGAITHILCNRSSILSTYHSNHTLQKLCPSYQYNDVYLPEDLRSLLRINRESSTSDAARCKITNAHFSGSTTKISIFTDMKSNVLPIAIAWFGQDGGSDGISNVFFAFLRSMPLLCNTNSNSKKRKLQA